MTLKQAIKAKNVAEIRKITKVTPIADIADMLEELSQSNIVVFFRLLKTETQSDIFAHLEPEFQEMLVKYFTDDQMKEIVGDLYSAEIADLIEDVPDELATRILKSTDKETRNTVNKLLKYNDDQTGSIMSVDIVLFRQSQTIGQAIQKIKRERDEVRMSHLFFVTDSKQKLAGYVAVEDLLFGTKSTKLSTILKPTPSVTTTTDKEEAALQFANYDLPVLPVINSQKQVIGMITSDEVIDIVTEEATEDINKMAGIESANDASYSKSSVGSIFRSRSM